MDIYDIINNIVNNIYQNQVIFLYLLFYILLLIFILSIKNDIIKEIIKDENIISRLQKEGKHYEFCIDKDDICPICHGEFTLENLKIILCKYGSVHKIHKDCLEICEKNKPNEACFECRD
jgi:hypothetical protein